MIFLLFEFSFMKMNEKHVLFNLFVHLFYPWEISSETKKKILLEHTITNLRSFQWLTKFRTRSYLACGNLLINISSLLNALQNVLNFSDTITSPILIMNYTIIFLELLNSNMNTENFFIRNSLLLTFFQQNICQKK